MIWAILDKLPLRIIPLLSAFERLNRLQCMNANTAFIIRKAGYDDISSVAYINAQSWQTTYRDIIAQNFLETITPDQ